MVKTIFILKGPVAKRHSFCEEVQTRIVPMLLEAGARTVKVTATVTPPPGVSIIPFSKTPIACISVSGDEALAELLDNEVPLTGVYQVWEAVPVSYQVTWALGRPTPGACLLTLFNRKPGLNDETFIDRWQGGHTPLSLKLHPLWNYVRNQVTRTCRGEPWDGIVEEQVRTRNELTNPIRFFGGKTFLYGMWKTFWDTRGFIDMGTIETYLAEETWFKR